MERFRKSIGISNFGQLRHHRCTLLAKEPDCSVLIQKKILVYGAEQEDDLSEDNDDDNDNDEDNDDE